jgi:UDP-N-acetylglucosamine acyltransferase
MATNIHPTAVIEPGVEIGADVEIGAYAFVGGTARIGDRTRLHHHACVEGDTRIGRECEIFPFANIGAKTQDLKYNGGAPGVRIGDRNVFREYVTVHAATGDGGLTVVGNDNLILAYCHIAHDCRLGNHIIMSSYAGLAGHVVVEDHVTIGANAGVHQFCRMGAYAMLGGLSKIVQDVAPFMIADGNPAVIRSINKVGLERKGFTVEQIERIKLVHRLLFRDGLNRSQALEKIAAHPQADSAEMRDILEFARKSERGLAPGA